MLLNLTKPTIKEDIPDNQDILCMRPSARGAGSRKEGVIQELAQLTMSMIKKVHPVADTLNYYKCENLFPFHDIDGQGELNQADRTRDLVIDRMLNRDGSFLIIT